MQKNEIASSICCGVCVLYVMVCVLCCVVCVLYCVWCVVCSMYCGVYYIVCVVYVLYCVLCVFWCVCCICVLCVLCCVSCGVCVSCVCCMCVAWWAALLRRSSLFCFLWYFLLFSKVSIFMCALSLGQPSLSSNRWLLFYLSSIDPPFMMCGNALAMPLPTSAVL